MWPAVVVTAKAVAAIATPLARKATPTGVRPKWRPIATSTETGTTRSMNAPPIVTIPTIPSPQRCRTSFAERLTAVTAPGSSSAITGTTKNVAAAQARPSTKPASLVATQPPRTSRSACKARPTRLARSDHARIAGSRRFAQLKPSLTEGSCPSSARCPSATNATPRVRAHDARREDEHGEDGEVRPPGAPVRGEEHAQAGRQPEHRRERREDEEARVGPDELPGLRRQLPTAAEHGRRSLAFRRLDLPRRVHERQRHLDHVLEVRAGDRLVRRVDARHPVREVHAGKAMLVEDVRVRGAAAQRVARREPAPLERGRGKPDGQVVAPEPVAAVALLHGRLGVALRDPGRERDRVEHLLDELGELALVVRARLGEERAPLGDDVPGRAAFDQADVGGRLVVDPAQA